MSLARDQAAAPTPPATGVWRLAPSSDAEPADRVLARLAAGALAELKHKVEAALTRHDREDIHQVRVWLRRLRFLARERERLLADGERAGLAAQLRSAYRKFGRVRDLMVLEGEILPELNRDGVPLRLAERERIARLVRSSAVGARRILRGAAFAETMRAAEALGDPRPRHSELAAWSRHVKRWRRRCAGLDVRLRRELELARDSLLPTAAGLNPDLHLVRRRARRLRDQLVLIAPWHSGQSEARGTVRRYQRRLADLVSALGGLADLYAASLFLHSLEPDNEALADWLDARGARLRERAERAIKRFRESRGPF